MIHYIRNTLMVAVLAFGLQGCAMLGPMMDGIFGPPGVENVEPTARTKFALADAAYNTAVKAITKLGEMDVLSVVQLKAVEPVMILVDEILHRWETQLIEAKALRDLGLDNAALLQERLAASNSGLVAEKTKILHDVITEADKPLVSGG